MVSLAFKNVQILFLFLPHPPPTIWSNWNHSVSQCLFVKRSSTATSHSTLDLKRTQLQNNKICQSTKKQKTKKGKFHKNKTPNNKLQERKHQTTPPPPPPPPLHTSTHLRPPGTSHQCPLPNKTTLAGPIRPLWESLSPTRPPQNWRAVATTSATAAFLVGHHWTKQISIWIVWSV